MLVGQKTEQGVFPTTSIPIVSPNTLRLDERIAKALQTGIDFDALVGMVEYEVGISKPEARKKGREIEKQLTSV
jgi:hypothetical protein